MGKHRNPKEVARQLNEFRKKVGHTIFSRDYIYENTGLNNTYVSAAIRAGIFTKHRNGKNIGYTIDLDSIHFTRVEYMFNIIRKYDINNLPEIRKDKKIKAAIDMLKELGYRILKPVEITITEYEEV